MNQRVFAINGRYYDVLIAGLQRDFQILDNEDNAGRTTEGGMVRDIIGTYYNYKLDIRPWRMKLGEYQALYNLLSSPIDYVTLSITLGDEQMTFNAYVTKGSDAFTLVDGKAVWKGLSLSFVAMEPQRRPV